MWHDFILSGFMKNIKFEINEQDIREYLKKHRNDVAIKYREAMFVKYMREHQEITCESLEILMQKYHWEDKKINGIYHRDELGILKSEPLLDFSYYLDGITNLDISGICHILIPTIGYYDIVDKNFSSMTNEVIKELEINDSNFDEALRMAIDNYCVGGLINIYREEHFGFTLERINLMKKNRCRKELMEYSHIYGEDKVKQIRKIIRERV